MLVAASESRGTVPSADGLDVAALISLKQVGESVADLPHGDKKTVEAIIDVPCDIWIPAARPDVLHKDNGARLKAKIVTQGPNIPRTPEAEAMLDARGILILPDFVVNARGVICAATEYHGGTEAMAFAAINEKIPRNTASLIKKSRWREDIHARSGNRARD